MDELDRDHIANWDTVESLRPEVGSEDEQSEEEAEMTVTVAGVDPEWRCLPSVATWYLPNPAPAPPPLRGHFWLQERPKPRLALPSPTLRTQEALCIPKPLKTTWHIWQTRVQELATVHLSHTGPVPNLTAIRCHREDRRVQLLLWHSSARTMAGMVRVAARLAAEGCFPGPRSGGRQSEFIAR